MTVIQVRHGPVSRFEIVDGFEQWYDVNAEVIFPAGESEQGNHVNDISGASTVTDNITVDALLAVLFLDLLYKPHRFQSVSFYRLYY